MSAVELGPFDWAGASGGANAGSSDQSSAFEQTADVIDLAHERSRRRQRVDSYGELRALAMLRHPAGSAQNSAGPVGMVSTRDRVSVRSGVSVKSEESLLQLVRKSLIYVAVFISVVVLGGLAGLMLREDSFSGQTWQHSVSHGESLWSLAASINTARPIELVVEDIRELNSLESTTLQTGQELILPAY